MYIHIYNRIQNKQLIYCLFIEIYSILKFNKNPNKEKKSKKSKKIRKQNCQKIKTKKKSKRMQERKEKRIEYNY